MRDARPYTDEDIEDVHEQLGEAVSDLSVALLVGMIAKRVAIRELRQIVDPDAWESAEFVRGLDSRIRQRLDELAAWSPGE